jgi:uncharacterized membrane protein
VATGTTTNVFGGMEPTKQSPPPVISVSVKLTRAVRILSVILRALVALFAMRFVLILSGVTYLGIFLAGVPGDWSAKLVYNTFALIVYYLFCLLSCIRLKRLRLLVIGVTCTR